MQSNPTLAGQITDKEDRIAETVFREALQAPEAETCKGLAQHEKFMLTWTGAPGILNFQCCLHQQGRKVCAFCRYT